MKRLLITFILGFLLTGCVTGRHGLEGQKCPYIVRQDKFYSNFKVGNNQVIRSKSTEAKVEYNIKGDAGGYSITGKFYHDRSAEGYVAVAIMDSNWTIIAHVASNLGTGYSSPQIGRDFSMYINHELYDISKFSYIAFGQTDK